MPDMSLSTARPPDPMGGDQGARVLRVYIHPVGCFEKRRRKTEKETNLHLSSIHEPEDTINKDLYVALYTTSHHTTSHKIHTTHSYTHTITANATTMSSTTNTETSSTGAQRRLSTSSTSSLPVPLQNMVDEAEKEREVYEDSWSRIPRGLRIIIRPSKAIKQHEQNAKKSSLTIKKPHLPASLQHLVDKEEKEEALFEDSWARIPRALGLGKSSKKSATKP
ncbi:hypothetical protein PV04_06102 [Phialophora macrospora]|uniref:Uncharacterized protein n=1 Tax=Phialophora macrospora TaxID=1851006 RepID=A0A0D2FFH6_9EURO|nr:hypothetical protein PV04_06102 [Phialophora macrospora]